MFNPKIYINRRNALSKAVSTGVILFLGNDESPMNYADNTYPYRQDSTFLYFFGLDLSGLTGIIDIDENKEFIFGDDISLGDIVWMGPQKTIAEQSRFAGIKRTGSLSDLVSYLDKVVSQGRKVHFIPQYRSDNFQKIEEFLGIKALAVNQYTSITLTKAVIALRSIKSKDELDEIEKAIKVSYEVHTAAMKISRPGLVEREVYGILSGIADSLGNGASFPSIFSVHGETLHNHHYKNIMKDGDLIVHDSGVSSSMHYASDITRTFPVNGKFSLRQKEVYQIVLKAQLTAINAMNPGTNFKNVHLKAAKVIASGLKDLGLMKGSVDEAVNAGAHALFFPHGLGHMLGLDVHDMENFGEGYVGYDNKSERSTQFGLSYLRLAKPLKPGYVVTIEPGIYFIPELINKWETEKKFTQYINYNKVKSYIGFGGIRIEDDIVVQNNGHSVLGKPIPKTVSEVENICNRQ